jgi:DNA primase catalytic core
MSKTVNDWQEVKLQIKLHEWVSKRFQTKGLGNGMYRVVKCPKCGHRDCFTMWEKGNNWKCFSCDSGGDIFKFLVFAGMAGTEHEALLQLAKEIGYDMQRSEESKKHFEEKNRIREIFTEACKYYRSKITTKAKNYLRNERGRTDDAIKKAWYGYSDGKLTLHLTNLKYTKTDLLKSGLVKDKDGTLIDRFWKGSTIYPHFYNGQCVDFTAKNYNIEKAKRIPIQVPTKNKLSLPAFYGKNAIFKDMFVIVEGEEDRLSIVQYYDVPVVAVIGNFSPEQIDFLKDKCKGKTIHLALDPDAAGRKYEDKIMDALGAENTILKWIWDAEEGDIDNVLRKRKSAEFVQEEIETANDYISYRINDLPDISDMSPQIASGHYQGIVKWIGKLPDEIMRVSYLEHLARKLGGKSTYLASLKRMVANNRQETDGQKLELVQENVRFFIHHADNRYYRDDRKNDGHVKVSDFVMKINRYVELHNEIFYEVIATNSGGTVSKPIMFEGGERVNMRQFRERMAREGGPGFYFSGNDADLQEIWLYEESKAKDLSRTCYFQRFGFIKEHNLWLFRNCAIQQGKLYPPDEDGVIQVGDIGYLSKDVNIYSGDAPQLNIAFDADKTYCDRIVNLFRQMFDSSGKSYSGCLALGSVGCLVYLHELLNYDRKFPFLLLYGPSGSGKNEALMLVMNILGFSNDGENWGEASAPGISMAIEQLCSLPYWMDEYKNTVGQNTKQDKKIQIVNNIYNRTSAGKGGLTNRTIREVNGVIYLTGQDRPEDKAALSRCVTLNKTIPDKKASAAYWELKAERPRLSSIFVHLLKNKTPEKVKEIINYVNDIRDSLRSVIDGMELRENVDERSLYNYSVFAAGFIVVFGTENFNVDKFTSWLAEDILADVRRKNKEDILYKFFSSIETIHSDVYHVIKKEGNILYLAFYQAHRDWKMEGVKLGMSEYLAVHTMMDYMKDDIRGYYMNHGRTRFYNENGRPFERRCILLQIDKLPGNIKEFADALIDEDVRRGHKPSEEEDE